MGKFAQSVGVGILGIAASLAGAGNARADDPAATPAPATAPATPQKAPISAAQSLMGIRKEMKAIDETLKGVGALDQERKDDVLIDLGLRAAAAAGTLDKLEISGSEVEVRVMNNVRDQINISLDKLSKRIQTASEQPVPATAAMPAPVAPVVAPAAVAAVPPVAPAPVAPAPAAPVPVAPAPAAVAPVATNKATAPAASVDAIAAYRSAKIDGLFIKAEQRVGGVDYLKNVLGEGQAAVDKIMAFQTKREFKEYFRILDSNLNQMQRIPAQKTQAAAPTGAVVNPLADPRAAQAYRFREDNHAIGTAFAGQRFVFNEQNQRERVVRGAINNFRTATDAARNFRRFLDGK